MEGFIMKKINIAEQSFNPFELIGKKSGAKRS